MGTLATRSQFSNPHPAAMNTGIDLFFSELALSNTGIRDIKFLMYAMSIYIDNFSPPVL